MGSLIGWKGAGKSFQVMNQEPNLLSELNAALPDLNKSETKVANAILEDPEAATRSSIAVLAAAAKVSEPSVNRFCKRFGARGFPDFKLRLARVVHRLGLSSEILLVGMFFYLVIDIVLFRMHEWLVGLEFLLNHSLEDSIVWEFPLKFLQLLA